MSSIGSRDGRLSIQVRKEEKRKKHMQVKIHARRSELFCLGIRQISFELLNKGDTKRRLEDLYVRSRLLEDASLETIRN